MRSHHDRMHRFEWECEAGSCLPLPTSSGENRPSHSLDWVAECSGVLSSIQCGSFRGDRLSRWLIVEKTRT